MSETNEQRTRIKPLFLIKPKTIGARDIRRAEKMAGICIIECQEPEAARFLEPPIDAEIDVQARAALSLMRYIMRNTTSATQTYYASTLIQTFVDALMYAPTPAKVPSVKKNK